jgi:hypothetical protein
MKTIAVPGGGIGGIVAAIGRPLPKGGVCAHHEAEVVADNIGRPLVGLMWVKHFPRGRCKRAVSAVK